MSKKVNWATVDKRIRNRRRDVSSEEQKGIEAQLQKLPDLAEEAEIIDIPQPAVAVEEDVAEEGAAAPEGEPAN